MEKLEKKSRDLDDKNGMKMLDSFFCVVAFKDWLEFFGGSEYVRNEEKSEIKIVRLNKTEKMAEWMWEEKNIVLASI